MPVQTPFAQDKKYSITARCKKSKGEDSHVFCVLSYRHILFEAQGTPHKSNALLDITCSEMIIRS
jgi:hypothetical protein